MKHVLVFVLIALSIYYLAIRKTELDTLMVPVANYTEAQVGNHFVEMEQERLPVEPWQLAEPGVITVIYFYDEKCPSCRVLDGNLVDFLRVRPDVAVRKVRVGPEEKDFAKANVDYQWRIFMSPCILIFSKDGKLIAADDRTATTGQKLLYKWINAELRKDYERKNKSI